MPQGKYTLSDVSAPQQQAGKFSAADLTPDQQKLYQHNLTAPSVMDDMRNRVIDFTRPFLPALAGAIGSIVGTPAGGAAAATAAYTGLDYAAQRAKAGSPEYDLYSSVRNLIGSEVLPRAAIKVGSGLLGYALEKSVPGSVAPIRGLAATFGQQMLAGGYKKLAGVSNWIEDLFYGGGKEEAIQKTNQLASDRIADTMASLSGRTKSAVTNPQWLSINLRQKLENNLVTSYKASNDAAASASLIAKGNSLDIPVTAAEASTLPASTIKIVSNPQTGTQFLHSIEGPIQLDNYANSLQNFLNDKYKLYSTIDKMPADEKPLVTIAQNTLNRIANIDPKTGQITGVKPMSFKDAWTYKSGLDDLAQPTYGEGGQAIYSNANKIARNFSNELSDSIESSIGNWQNGVADALNNYLNAKAIVHQRHNVFRNVGQFLNGYNSAVPKLDQIVNDPERLQSAIKTGNLNLIPGSKLQVTRNDLAAYKLGSMYYDAKGNGASLTDYWNDPHFIDSKQQLYSAATRNSLDQFFKDLNLAQYKSMGLQGASRNKIWMTRAGIMLAPSLATGVLSGSELYGASMLGIELGGLTLGRILVNPEKARLLSAMVKGVPLGMSNEKAMRLLMNGVQGAAVSIYNNDGSQVPAEINKDGQIEASSK